MNNLHKKKDVYELTRLNNLFTRNEINIPGFDDYRVLKCDFHTHTVFSDGLVWPDGRIYEALCERRPGMKFVTEPSAASGMIRLPLKRRNESSFVMGDHGIKIF